MSDAAWRSLVSGAQRSTAARRATMQEHRPSVAVLSCSDARVPPSIVFDQPAGELFVVRIAGNTASPTAIASLEYAVANLAVELIVVLGHTGCGAVAAASAGVCSGALGPVVEPICRLARAHPDATATELEELNVAHTVAALARAGGAITEAHDAGNLRLVGALYDLNHATLRTVVLDGERTISSPSTTPVVDTSPSTHVMETS